MQQAATKPKRRSETASVLVLLVAWSSSPHHVAGQEPRDPVRQWALLIGVEKYHRAAPLRYTVNDVRQLSETLRRSGGFDSDRILEMTDIAANPRFQPLKASLMAELPQWLARPGPNDRVIVYFSGHGFRDPSGKLYLAPIDCDPRDPAATGIAVEWFREQIAACRAEFKLLILDACHAGSEKSDDEDRDTVAAKDLGNAFLDVSRVVTIASSTEREKSQIWDEKQQSLFSYWLKQAFKGHADEDGDASVDIDELYKYVHRNVTRTAHVHFPRPQTPVRIVRPGSPGVPEVVRVRPQNLKQLLGDIAEQLGDALAAHYAGDIKARRLPRVGVLEFEKETPLGEELDPRFRLLGRWCAVELHDRLTDYGAGRFSVVDRRRMETALADLRFSDRDLGDGNRLEELATRTGGLPVLALGRLRGRQGNIVSLRCELMEKDSADPAGSAGGIAMITESEWAMLGKSVQVRPDDRRPEPPSPDRPAPPQADLVIDRLDQRAHEPHPLSNARFPFPVRVNIVKLQNGETVSREERKLVFRGNDCFVPVRAGENYEIEIENRSGQLVCLRLLVDGLNTQLEDEDVKGIVEKVVAKRVNLNDARHSVLDPQDRDVRAFGKALWRVGGFVTKTGAAGEEGVFRVVDGQQSLAARQQFTDQIGWITAAFYAPAGGTRGLLGTDISELRKRSMEEYHRAVRPGNLLAVVHIRYVDADELSAAER